MKHAEEIILRGIVADLLFWTAPERESELAAMPIGDWASPERLERGRCLQAWHDANQGGGLVRIDLMKWHGPYSDSERVMLGRAMKRMEERDKLIERFAFQGFKERLTHVGLTSAGVERAMQLLPAEVATIEARLTVSHAEID